MRSFKEDDTLQRRRIAHASLRVSSRAILTASLGIRGEAFFLTPFFVSDPSGGNAKEEPMQRIDNQTKLLKSVSQLIPSPDVFGVETKLKALPERDRVAKLLESCGDETFFVKMEQRNCFRGHFRDDAGSLENGLFVTAELPNVRVFLYCDSFPLERLISEDDEALFCRFMKQLGYDEVTIPPQTKDDRIESRLFSLPNEGRADQ